MSRYGFYDPSRQAFIDGSRPDAPFARLTPVGTDLAFESSFDRALVDAFKLAIPASARKWDPAKKRWLVAPQYAQACAKLAQQYLNVRIEIPKVQAVNTVETRLILLEYLGRAKERNGESSAFGWVDGGWNAIFPEAVLRTWFDAPKQPTENQTLYQTLAIKQGATTDEVRTAYRRMAKIYHPDVNKEPDAAENFKAVHHAYEILSDPVKAKKYQAGLFLEAQATKSEQRHAKRVRGYEALEGVTYSPPFRSGYVLVEGQESIGRFLVQKINMWEDIVDAQGRVFVSSWPAGAEHFEVRWA